MKSLLPIALVALVACQPTAEPNQPTASPTQAYAGILPQETIRFTGTEPFWGGSTSAGTLSYATPEYPQGREFKVTRFAGNNGIAISGNLEGMSFDMTITPGECSDGMSDRTYPFTATLLIGTERRNGCAWTDAQPFSGPANP